MRRAKQIWVGKLADYDGEAFVPGFAQNHTMREKIDLIGWINSRSITSVFSLPANEQQEMRDVQPKAYVLYANNQANMTNKNKLTLEN